MLVSLTSRPVSGLPLDFDFAGSAPATAVSRPAQRSLTFRPACSLNLLRGPLPECFGPCRCLHKPLWLLPAGTTVAGRGSHPQGKRAFPRRTKSLAWWMSGKRPGKLGWYLTVLKCASEKGLSSLTWGRREAGPHTCWLAVTHGPSEGKHIGLDILLELTGERRVFEVGEHPSSHVSAETGTILEGASLKRRRRRTAGAKSTFPLFRAVFPLYQDCGIRNRLTTSAADRAVLVELSSHDTMLSTVVH